MRIGREAFLKVLESVSPGLAPREIIQQSSCLVFTDDGMVSTFNDEICARRKSPLKLSGAVGAKALVNLLSKMSEDEIDVEQVGKELRVKGKGKRAGIPMEMEVLLPVSSVDSPTEWRPITAEFSEAVSIVHSCASSEESLFVMTCVHVTPDYMEACDKNQIAHYPLKTGVIDEMLVRGASLKKILGYDMTEISESPSWLHFRNPAGLVISVRRYLEDYPSLSKFTNRDGIRPIALPGGIAEAVERATIFSSENSASDHILVSISSGWLVLKGTAAIGWYEEGKKVDWTDDPIKFLISPKLLVEISKRTKDCGIGDNRLFVDGGKWTYVTSTNVVEEVA